MAVVTCAYKKQKQTSQFILENPQISVSKSIEFMQRMLVVSMSNIAFFRNIFPYDAFMSRRWEKIGIMILRGNDDLPDTKIMVNWIRSTFELIESNILKKVILLIQEKDSKKPMEMYTFSFGYNQEAIKCHIIQKEVEEELMIKSPELPYDVRGQVEQLLQSLIALTSRKPPLPDNIEVSMRIELNENVGPDFQPPAMFQCVDSLDITFPHGAQTLKLGKIETKYTTLAVTEKSVEILDENECAEAEEGKPVDNVDDLDMDMVMSSQGPRSSISFTEHSQFFPTPSYSEVDARKLDVETSKLSISMSSVDINDKEVACICQVTDKSEDLIKCESCGRYQHKPCYKLLTKQNVARHICVDCHNPADPSKTCTDPALIDEPKPTAKALYRRALNLCLSTVRVSPETFMTSLSVSRNMAMQMFMKLETDKCLHPSSGRSGVRTVKLEHLKANILPTFFNLSEHPFSEEMMDARESGLKSGSTKRHSQKDENTPANQQSEVPRKKKRTGVLNSRRTSRKN